MKQTITPNEARKFFLYQDRDSVEEGIAEIMGTDVGTVEARIDWGIDAGGDMTGGDIIFGPRFGERNLTDDELVSLAEHMGASSWDQPSWPPITPAVNLEQYREQPKALIPASNLTDRELFGVAALVLIPSALVAVAITTMIATFHSTVDGLKILALLAK